ncbi:uncharacterized protein [Blastocystis hominis]|uniref:Uncharacterized protein n=1 Tax=Blastocystis hominis TaxID=12968 RepID=D8M9D0_BLAHO|nr:uncharacterized protein [Blastocystis hominis]CBK24669.2 unnamed protein product [Blastocystis hominis]|eukprot:XP_012898717.1 uncharacterized protein [Blastocystis hominis]
MINLHHNKRKVSIISIVLSVMGLSIYDGSKFEIIFSK